MSVTAPAVPGNPPADRFRIDLRVLVGLVFGVAILATVAFVVQFEPVEAVSVVGAAIVVSGASGVVGAFVGFLFGIPRTLQEQAPTGQGTSYLANTNLEQISDWLTKILVGIGLVQITQIPGALSSLAASLSPAFGGAATSPTFALSLVIYFAIAGLAMGYLWTRTFLPGILRASDQDLTTRITDILQVNAETNAYALTLVGRVLSGQSPPTDRELSQALEQATPDCLVTVYQQAEEQRLLNWRTDKDVMARTIPIFRALGALDKERRFYRHFASLGFSLKDQAIPSYDDALAALTAAITVRNQRGTRGLGIYEWNRALCNIKLDAAGGAGPATPSSVRDVIEADLRIAAKQLADDYFQGGPDADKAAIKAWMDATGLDLAALRS